MKIDEHYTNLSRDSLTLASLLSGTYINIFHLQPLHKIKICKNQSSMS